MEHIRYPKTPRLADIQELFPQWRKHTVVVEEKVDGANLGIQWSDDGPVYQSRGHILRGGAREIQFAPVYNWGASRSAALREALEGGRFMIYGEWCFAKHRAFYDALPDLFLGFDVLDIETGLFLPHDQRDQVLSTARIVSVPHLYTGVFGKAPAFASHIKRSRLKTSKWRAALATEAGRVNARDPMKQTDNSDDMEGVYARVEAEGQVVARFKVHREGFEKVCSDGWEKGPHIRNCLAT